MEETKEKIFTSIEEIDADLEEEFRKTEVTPTPEPTEIKKTEEVKPSVNEPTEPTPQPSAQVETPAQPAKPTKEEQQEHSWAKLRQEKEEALKEKERLAKALETKETLLTRLAKVSGFDDINEYQKSLEDRIIEEEAKKHGLPPETYRELEVKTREVKALEERNKALEQQQKIVSFSNEIAKVVDEYKFDPEIGNTLIARFTEMGYTLDTLLAVPHPELLIKGALLTEIQAKELERAQNIQRVQEVDTTSIITTPPPQPTLDDILDAEMEAYARSRNIKIPKK